MFLLFVIVWNIVKVKSEMWVESQYRQESNTCCLLYKVKPCSARLLLGRVTKFEPPCSSYFSFHCLSYFEGCPIHPTRVDSSLVFAIRQTGNRFENPILSNGHESFRLLSIRHSGSRFVRDLENIVDLYFEGGLKMLSIRVDSIESTRIGSPVVHSSYRESICIYRYFTDLDFRWAIQGG